eukprot:SAG22_NODE_107_length_19899_cov_24.034141_6_plen_79_part_00
MWALAVWSAKMQVTTAVHHSTAGDCGCFGADDQYSLSNILDATVLETDIQSVSSISEAPNCARLLFSDHFFDSLHGSI